MDDENKDNNGESRRVRTKGDLYMFCNYALEYAKYDEMINTILHLIDPTMDLKQELIDNNNLRRTTKLTTITSAAFYDEQAQHPDQFAYNNNKTNNSSPPSGADDGTCEDSIPFTMLATKMQDVTKDGGIKKTVLYGGYGPILQDTAVVSIWYEAYLEYDHMPFDSAVVNRKPYTFTLGKEDALATLSLAVQTMKVHEVSQFLIHPIYVFGTRGFLKPVPPHSAILLKITIKNVVKLSTKPKPATVDGTCKDSTPFAMIATKMQDVTKEGGIKKRVLYQGYGSVLPENAVVSIWYEAYLEYDDLAFDSTVVKRKSYTFSLGKEVALATLSLAVQTMKIREESEFLIQPNYVFGTRGFLKPVPPHSVILLKITVKNALKLSAHNQEFHDVYIYAHFLSSKAKRLYDKGLYRKAIKEYSAAVFWLEYIKTKDRVEQEKQQQLRLRVLTNLVTLYTKLEEPRRGCTNANKIYNLCKTGLLKIPVKVFFNHARCLTLLLNFKAARSRLEEAQKLEPHNQIITNELTKLVEKMNEIHNKEMVVRKVPNAEVCKLQSPEISREFKKAVTQYCEEILDDDCSLQYKLPDRLTQKELEFCEKEMRKYGFAIEYLKLNGIDGYFILKTANVAKY